MTKFVDIMMMRGDTQIIDVEVKDSTGMIINLSSTSFWFTVKNFITDPDDDVVFQKTLGDGITVTSASLGQVRITIAHDDTSGLATENIQMVYDLQMKNSLDQIWTINSGNFVVVPDVTRGIS